MSEEDSGAQVIITDESPILYPLVLVPVLGACASCYCPADGAGCIDWRSLYAAPARESTHVLLNRRQ